MALYNKKKTTKKVQQKRPIDSSTQNTQKCL